MLEVLHSGVLGLGPFAAALRGGLRGVLRHALRGRGVERHRRAAPRRAPRRDRPGRRGDHDARSPSSPRPTAVAVRARRRRSSPTSTSARFNIDPDAIEAAITPRTKAMMPVHIFGLPAEMDRINAIAARHGLAVIEDAAEAVGTVRAGRRVGGDGNPAIFAFYPNKQMTTGEGGIVTTDDEDVYAQLKSLSNQGRSDTGDWLEHDRLGYNYRLDELSAAVGLAQVERLDEILAGAGRGRRALRRAARRRCDGVTVPAAPATGRRALLVRVRGAARRRDRPQRRDGGPAGAGRGLQAVPAGRPPAAVLPRARAPRGRAAGVRGDRPLDAGAAVPHRARRGRPGVRRRAARARRSPPASAAVAASRTCCASSRRRSSARWSAATASSTPARTPCRRRCWPPRVQWPRDGRAREPAGLADHRRVAAADRRGAQRRAPAAGARTASPRVRRPTAVARRRRRACRRPGRHADAAVPVLPPGALAAVAARPDAARGRRPDDGRDRARVPRARGDDGPAHQPGQAARSGPAGVPFGPPPAERARGAPARRAARPVPDLQRGLHGQLRARPAARRAHRPRRSG